LTDVAKVSLGTTTLFKRCVDAIKNHKAYAEGSLDEYCSLFASNLERFRITNKEEEFDDAVIENIEEFRPYRSEMIQLFTVIAQYCPSTECIHRLHRLFEELLPYLHKPSHITHWTEWDFDNFKFIIHELFLYVLAILLRNDRIDQTNCFLQEQYYIPGQSEYGRDVMVSFAMFREPLRSLAHRNKRLNLRRLSVRADLLNERCSGTGVDFRYLMQADFVAFMRAELEATERMVSWWPETLLYRQKGPFEIFARSISKHYFDKVKVLLAINSPKDLEPLLNRYQDGSQRLPRWEFESFDPATLLGFENLATRP